MGYIEDLQKYGISNPKFNEIINKENEELRANTKKTLKLLGLSTLGIPIIAAGIERYAIGTSGNFDYKSFGTTVLGTYMFVVPYIYGIYSDAKEKIKTQSGAEIFHAIGLI